MENQDGKCVECGTFKAKSGNTFYFWEQIEGSLLLGSLAQMLHVAQVENWIGMQVFSGVCGCSSENRRRIGKGG